MVRFEPRSSYTAVRHTTITTTTTIYGPFSGTTPGELVPEENFWTLWLVSDIAIFVLKRDVKLQLTNSGLYGAMED